MRKYYTEGVGTFILVLTLGLSSEPLAIGFIYISLVYCAFSLSGAHFNPAISFAFFLKKDLSLSEFTGYALSQVLGAFLAAAILPSIINTVFFVQASSTSTYTQQITVELLFSFLWVLLFLVLVKSRNFKGTHLHGLVLGVSLAGFIMIAEPISGGIFNPAISIGTSVFDFFTGGNSYESIPLYTLSSLAGASLAYFVFSKMDIKENRSPF